MPNPCGRGAPLDQRPARKPAMDGCQLCGAPGGYPYCNRACEDADAHDE